MIDQQVLAAARGDLQAGRWKAAKAGYEASLAQEESGDAHDGIAEALWWLCDAPSSVRHREQAFVAFTREGDLARAAMAAVNLSIAYLLNLGNEAAARGWLGRAERLVAGEGQETVAGWVTLMRGYMAPDAVQGRALFAEALDHARKAADIDLELVALSDLGLARVVSGQTDEGMALLDEAMAGTLAGEYRRLDTVVYTSCNMLAACSLLGDIERAAQWCRAADRFMETYSCPFLFARCRVHYGTVLLAKGRWAQAEQELRVALQLAEDVGPEPHTEAVVRLAQLWIRQGRLEDVDALLLSIDDLAAAALPIAALHLAREQPKTAVAVLERRLSGIDMTSPEAASALALLVDAYIADHKLDAAKAAADRLSKMPRSSIAKHAAALSAVASARLAAALGKPGKAVTHLELALERFRKIELPVETAETRLQLAQLLATSRPELAILEARSALAIFEDVGASRLADEAASLLRSLGSSGRSAPKKPGSLTKREEEVLRLVGLGLTNPEIANRLFISRKTASHHVSNLLMKLGLRNRAEAVAYAGRLPRDANRP